MSQRRKSQPAIRPGTESRHTLGLLLLWGAALVGYFAPWMMRPPASAALAWNAYDLYAIVRLLPEIENGTLTVNLQMLQLPLLGLALMLPFLATRRSAWERYGVALLGCLLASMTLPPYPQILDAWRTPGWRVPFWWGIGTILCCLIVAGYGPRLEGQRAWWLMAGAELALLPAVATLVRLLPALSRLHAATVIPGWGFWLCTAGLLGIGAGSMWDALREAR